MYSELTKVGIDVKRKIESLPSLNARILCDKDREMKRQNCFGTSEVFFCGCMKCPRRKSCEKRVSPWNFD
jgi:hypothetical protein